MKIPFWLAADKDLTCTAKIVYSCLSTLQHGKAASYPRQSTLAQMIGVSRRATQMSIAELEKRGLLQIHKACIAGRIHNTYSATPPTSKTHAIPSAKNAHVTNREEEEVPDDCPAPTLPPLSKPRRRGPNSHAGLLAMYNRMRRQKEAALPTPTAPEGPA